MQDGSSSQTLKVLVVTEDRAVQRQLSRFFSLVGYESIAAADGQQALAADDAANPQILLLDAELAAAADWSLCRQLSERSAAGPTFNFLLVDEPDESHLHEALEAGVDDFLLKPISHGELLSRVRSAARVLEYERRIAQQGRIDSVTGLLSLSAFTAHLRRQLSEHHGVSPRVACVVLDIDFFSRVARASGTPAAEALLQAFAEELSRLRTGSEIFGCMTADRFCVMLPGADEPAARQWAETTRDRLAEAAFKLGDATLLLSASFGVAACEPDESAPSIIQRATQALATAKTLGRDCVVTWSDHRAGSTDRFTPEALFEGTVVRDVMTPCSVFLRPEETVGESLAVAHRTSLDVIPVVDNGGKLLGVCEVEACANVAEVDRAAVPLQEVMTTQIRTFDEGESLASLMEFFHADSASWALVTADGRPQGLVTCDGLVAMSRPTELGALVPEGEYSDTSDYLLVPEHGPLAHAHAE